MSALILKLPSLIFHLSVALRMTHCASGRRIQAASAQRPSQVSLLPAHTQGPSGLHHTCPLLSESTSRTVLSTVLEKTLLMCQRKICVRGGIFL